jgi:hypothetical protein
MPENQIQTLVGVVLPGNEFQEWQGPLWTNVLIYEKLQRYIGYHRLCAVNIHWCTEISGWLITEVVELDTL